MGFTRRAAIRGLLTTTIGALTGAGAYGIAYERHRIGVTHADLPVLGLPPRLDGLKVGLLTDIHHSEMLSATDVARTVDLMRAAAPDLIVLGGDYVTWGDQRFLAPVAELLSSLDAPHGVFAILGNHDNERDTTAALTARRIQVLRDARTRLEVRGEHLELVGLRFWTRRPSDIARPLRGSKGTTLLLAHDPRRLVEAEALGVPAVLSGHTHGGQVVIPGIGPLAARRFPVPSGLASRGNTSIFVSRGVGTVYIPVRLNCPPEVAIVKLRSRVATRA